MKHICIYTNPDVLEHKKNDNRVYWKFASCPKLLPEWWTKLDYDLRLYFAVKGFIVGYFEVEAFDNWETVDFSSNSWTEIKPIPQKPFQGFKYIDD